MARTVGRVPSDLERAIDVDVPPHMLWIDVYEPSTKEELAVNPEHVEEVESWLTNALYGRLGKAPIAVICGPSGSGRTTTIRALAKCMKFTVKEWVTTSKLIGFLTTDEGSHSMYELLETQFEEYLFKASRYSSVVEPLDLEKYIILVEDIPNVFLHDPGAFENILRRYTKFGLCPIIFICSAWSSQLRTENVIFKKKFMQELKIAEICFKPASETLLKSALERVIEEEKKKNLKISHEVARDSIDGVIKMACSDVRFAVNQLQYFVCGAVVYPVGRKKTERSELETEPALGRDPFVKPYKSLGRLLFSKKEFVMDPESGNMKKRICYDPNELERSLLYAPNLYLNRLFENYLIHLTDMKKIVEATECMSEASVLMSKEEGMDTKCNYGMFTSILGFLDITTYSYNKEKYSMRKPVINEAVLAHKEKIEKCMVLFPERIGERKSLLMETLPYYSKMNLTGLGEEKKAFVRSFSDLSLRY